MQRLGAENRNAIYGYKVLWAACIKRATSGRSATKSVQLDSTMGCWHVTLGCREPKRNLWLQGPMGCMHQARCFWSQRNEKCPAGFYDGLLKLFRSVPATCPHIVVPPQSRCIAQQAKAPVSGGFSPGWSFMTKMAQLSEKHNVRACIKRRVQQEIGVLVGICEHATQSV
jgi:hypothetical protein